MRELRASCMQALKLTLLIFSCFYQSYTWEAKELNYWRSFKLEDLLEECKYVEQYVELAQVHHRAVKGAPLPAPDGKVLTVAHICNH